MNGSLRAVRRAVRKEREGREKISRRRRLEAHVLARNRMLEPEQLRMQSLPPDRFGRGQNSRVSRRAAIQLVGEQRVASFAQVHANLVRASRLQSALDVGSALELLQNTNMGHCSLAPRELPSETLAIDWMPRMGGLECLLRWHPAQCDRPIRPLHAVRLKLLNQTRARRDRLGYDHHAAGLLVEAMHYSGTLSLVFFELTHTLAKAKCVDERSAAVAGRRMHHHSRSFDQHENVLIFVQHLDRQVFGLCS